MDQSGNPKVSVIIPSYNRADLLGRSVSSVLRQTYQDFELIVVDDCSTDNTRDVVMSFDDRRVKYVRLDKNSGTPAAPTNAGIGLALGQYIAVQDSDDKWLPDKLEKQVEVLDNVSPLVGVVYTDMWKIGRDGTKTRWRSPRVMPEDGIVYQQALGYRLANIGTVTLLARRECFDKVGLFDEVIPMFIDTEWLIRVSKHYFLYHIDEPLACYYETPGSVSSKTGATVAARKHILEKYFDDIRRDRRLLAQHYYDLGFGMLGIGQVRQGRSYLLQAARARPLSIKPLLLAFLSVFGRQCYAKALNGYAAARGLLSRG